MDVDRVGPGSAVALFSAGCTGMRMPLLGGVDVGGLLVDVGLGDVLEGGNEDEEWDGMGAELQSRALKEFCTRHRKEQNRTEQPQ